MYRRITNENIVDHEGIPPEVTREFPRGPKELKSDYLNRVNFDLAMRWFRDCEGKNIAAILTESEEIRYGMRLKLYQVWCEGELIGAGKPETIKGTIIHECHGFSEKVKI